jgi:hypothetical protein
MNIKGIAAGAGSLAVAGSLLFAPPASATAPPPYLRVDPATVQAGQAIEFLASCYGNRTEVTSPGLAAPVTLVTNSGSDVPPYIGHGTAGNRPGVFTASFTCTGGPTPYAEGTATVNFTVVCPAPTSKPVPSTTTPPSSSSVQPPTSSSEPPATTEGAVVPAAYSTTTDSCGTPATGVAPKAGTAKKSQVPVRPKGAPETGDGSEAMG